MSSEQFATVVKAKNLRLPQYFMNFKKNARDVLALPQQLQDI